MFRKILSLSACAFFVFSCSLFGKIHAAEPIFFEDFEGALSAWTDKYGKQQKNGLIVEDPLRPSNRVLTFQGKTYGSYVRGSIFRKVVKVTPGKTYVLSFDYLEMPSERFEGKVGGFIGFAEDTIPEGQDTGPRKLRWLAGPEICCGAEDDPLVDDGQWQSFSLGFNPFVNRSGDPWYISQNNIRLVLENFVTSGVIEGGVFFDNIRIVEGVPE